MDSEVPVKRGYYLLPKVNCLLQKGRINQGFFNPSLCCVYAKAGTHLHQSIRTKKSSSVSTCYNFTSRVYHYVETFLPAGAVSTGGICTLQEYWGQGRSTPLSHLEAQGCQCRVCLYPPGVRVRGGLRLLVTWNKVYLVYYNHNKSQERGRRQCLERTRGEGEKGMLAQRPYTICIIF